MDSSGLRRRSLGFLIQSAYQLEVASLVKYTALSLFADRFYTSLTRSKQDTVARNWLLQPLRESNLQLFALVSLWISSKIHNSHPLSVRTLKSFGDNAINEQHFTFRDFLEGEVVFLQVLNFEIRTLKISFVYLEELLIHFKLLHISSQFLMRHGSSLFFLGDNIHGNCISNVGRLHCDV